MSRGLIALLLLLLGCGPRLGPPRVDHGDVASLPIVHPDNDPRRWYVVLDMGELGERLWFFDTGYAYTTCDDAFIEELGLQPRGRVMVRGEAGTLQAERVRLPDFDLGEHRVKGLGCIVRDLGRTSSILDPVEVRVAGVVGADLLRSFRVGIDPAVPEVRLQDPATAPRIRRDDPDAVRLRREYGVGTRFLLPVSLQGASTWLVVDTGATHTYVDGARLGLTPSAHHRNVAIRATGSTGMVRRDLSLYRVRLAEVGPHEVGPLTVVDRPRQPWVPGLLGLNALGSFAHDYDFATGRVRLVPVHAAPVPSYRAWRMATRDEEEPDLGREEREDTPAPWLDAPPP